MNDKIENFIASMSLVFPKRFDDERAQVEWFKTWERALKNFDPWVVEAATQELIDTRTERSFPLVAEVRKACQTVIKREQAGKPQLDVRQGPKDDPFALADVLVNSNLGRQAARDNPSWIVPLHDFCREHGRLPEAGEIPRIKRIAHDTEQIEHAIALGQVTDLLPVLKRTRDVLRLRRDKLRRRLLGDEADTSTPSTFRPNPNYMAEERAAYRARMPENHRLASEWMDKICAEYGSFEAYFKARRPPGSRFQNRGS